MSRAAGPALLVAAAVLLAGCGTDSPTLSSSRAKASVSAAGASLRATAARPGFREVSTPWKAALVKVGDPGCPDGGSRWRLVGALTVDDPSRDGDGAVARLIGLLPASWHRGVTVGDLDDDPAAVLPATYGDGDDAVPAEISVLPAAHGWTYSLSARSACVTQ